MAGGNQLRTEDTQIFTTGEGFFAHSDLSLNRMEDGKSLKTNLDILSQKNGRIRVLERKVAARAHFSSLILIFR